jgi:hypothetical protein
MSAEVVSTVPARSAGQAVSDDPGGGIGLPSASGAAQAQCSVAHHPRWRAPFFADAHTMVSSRLLPLPDDIVGLLDDVALMTKVAVKKNAGGSDSAKAAP